MILAAEDIDATWSEKVHKNNGTGDDDLLSPSILNVDYNNNTFVSRIHPSTCNATNKK